MQEEISQITTPPILEPSFDSHDKKPRVWMWILIALAAVVVLGLSFVLVRKYVRSSKNTSLNRTSQPVVNPTPASGLVQSSPPSPPGFVCVTGVAVPKEEAKVSNTSAVRTAIQRIRDELGITIIWQLFNQNSTEADWLEYMKIAKEEGVQVLAANVEADNYSATCSGDNCTLDVQKTFLESVRNHPEVYDGVLFGYLIIDEPWEDPAINSRGLQSLYTQAKTITPNVPLVVGWSRELWRFGNKPGREFTDGMCDICLISALETRNGTLDEATLRANQESSRRIIKTADPNAMIFSSFPAFGNPGGQAGYSMPSSTDFQKVKDILLTDATLNAAAKLDGIIFQSWEAPTRNKSASQETLIDLPSGDSRLEIVRDTCH